MAAKSRKPLEQVLSSWEDFDLLDASRDVGTPEVEGTENVPREESALREEGGDQLSATHPERLPSFLDAQEEVATDDVLKASVSSIAPQSGQSKSSILKEDSVTSAGETNHARQLPQQMFKTSDLSLTERAVSFATPSDGHFDTEHGSLIDLDFDSLCHCLEPLPLRDICMVAQCCRRLREAAYSNSVWQALFSREWPEVAPRPPQPTLSTWRDTFFNRWKACRQLRFQDPSVAKWCSEGYSLLWQIAVNSDQSITCLTSVELSTWAVSGREPIFRNVSRHKRACKTGEKALMVPIDLPMLDLKGTPVVSLEPVTIPNPLNGVVDSEPPSTSAGAIPQQSPDVDPRTVKEHFFLVAEDKVRLYSTVRGCCRTLSTPTPEQVLALTDRVLELPTGAPEAVIATGGGDKVVRLWTLGARRKGEQRLLCSLRGHEDAVAFLSGARHDPSLLVSVGSAGTVKLWDAASALELRGATAGASKSCLATWKVPGPSAGIAVCENVCYVAGKRSVIAIDLRSLRILGPVASNPTRITAMAINVAGDRLCTGDETGFVLLWDPTQSDFQAPKPLAELTPHRRPVTQISIDRFKVVTLMDYGCRVQVSAADTGSPICTFPPEGDQSLHLDWRSDKLLMAMRGPLLLLGKHYIVSADFSTSVISLEGEERKEVDQGSREGLGRFWERPSGDPGDSMENDGISELV